MDHERLSAENLAIVDQVVRTTARRHHLLSDEAEDLRSSVLVKLLENDCAVLRRFEGRSHLRTYLLVVVQSHFLDERNKKWGKWRPCRDARRAGDVGILLDRMLTRDKLSFDEAYLALTTNHGVTKSREELYELSKAFPDRSGRRFVGEESLATVPSGNPGPDAVLEGSVRGGDLARVRDALDTGLEKLSAQDCLLIKMHFCDAHPLSQVARRLNVPQKPLYPRFERLMAALRVEFELRGLRSDQVLALVGHPGVDLPSLILEAIARKFAGGPSR